MNTQVINAPRMSRAAMSPLARKAITTALLVAPWMASAGSMASASYAVSADSMDAGGRKATSAAYSNDGSVGGVGGISTAAAPAGVAKHGFVGQLYEAMGLTVSANPTNVNEGATRQLRASAVMDDATVMNLAGNSVGWSVVSGPISSINANGVALAGTVYQHTPATVQAAYLSRTATLDLLVRNINDDDYGLYAGDGLNDGWQVQNFGENSPDGQASADPDNDGQNNAYEEMVGSIPTDGSSLFRFHLELVPGQPERMNLIFSPRVAGRTYVVESRDQLDTGGFAPLGPIAVSDAGSERTVTDLSAAGAAKFYRVQISRP